jgi:hypothetical protein
MPSTTRRRHVSTLTLVAGLAAVLGAARGDDGVPQGSSAACDRRQGSAGCWLPAIDRAAEGTCASAPDGRPTCHPNEPPPAPESVSACDSKHAGDACSVAFGPLTLSGACAAVQDVLACRPSGPHGAAR